MTEEKKDWKGIVLPLVAMALVFGVAWVIGQFQRHDSLPEGIGTGDNYYWTTVTEHPYWAANATQAGPVWIFAHSTNCAPCLTQTDINKKIYAEYRSNITYFDLISGTDEPKASQTFDAYDPSGEAHYIPLTVVLTNGPDGTLIWHSWEGVVEEKALSAWIDDAIEYHELYG